MPRSLEEWWTFSRILQVYATHSPSPFHLWRWSYRNTWTSTCKFFEILRSSFLCSCLYVDSFFFYLISFVWRCHFFSRMMKSKIVLEIFTIWSRYTCNSFHLKKKMKKRERTIQDKLLYNFTATPIAMNFTSACTKHAFFTISFYFICSDQKVFIQLKKFI